MLKSQTQAVATGPAAFFTSTSWYERQVTDVSQPTWYPADRSVIICTVIYLKKEVALRVATALVQPLDISSDVSLWSL